jgi:hypothetical protein
MPQPLNTKDTARRITDTIAFIEGMGMGEGARYRIAGAALRRWVLATPQPARDAISVAMHRGFHVEIFTTTAFNNRLSEARKRRRAMILVRAALLGRTAAVAQTETDRVPEAQMVNQLKTMLLDYAEGQMPVVAADTPSGRMQRIGIRTHATYHQPFFATQDALHVHFTGIGAAIVNPVTRRIYQRALGTVGRTFWVAGGNTQANIGRFDRFAGSAYGEGIDQLNCWEGVMFCAVKEDALTVAACRHFYNAGRNPYTQEEIAATNDLLRQFFGTEGVFDRHTAHPGDVLTWENRQGVLNHVALYMGLGPAPDHQHPYVLHNLSIDLVQDGVNGGTTHFQTLDGVNRRYVGGGTCYRNTPFWDNTGNTPQYQYVQGLIARL